MTVTRHRLQATMDVPHTEYASTFYRSTWQGEWPSGLPDNGDPALVSGWHGTYLSRAYNDRTGLSEPRLTAQALGDDLWAPTAAIPAGRWWRMIATVRNVGTIEIAPYLELGNGNGALSPAMTLAPGQAQTLTVDRYEPATSMYMWVHCPTPNAVFQVADVTLDQLTVVPVLDLRPEQATIRLDESWSPYAQATLVCPLLPASTRDLIDPRQPQRVKLTMSTDSGTVRPVSALTTLANDSATTLRINHFNNPRPRSRPDLVLINNAWTPLVGNGAATMMALTGPGTTYPANIEGGGRMVVTTAATTGLTGWTVAAKSGATITGDAQWSIWVRTSVPSTVRLRGKTSTSGGVTVSDVLSGPVDLSAGDWTRLSVIGRPGGGSVHLMTVELGTYLPVGEVCDVTQAQVEGITAGTTPAVGEYFDGSMGRLGTPSAIPVWGPPTGWGNASQKQPIRRVVAPTTSATVADFTEMFKAVGAPLAYTIAYLTALFTDQYNTVQTPELNVSRPLDLGLRSREIDYVAGTMTLELASDEALLQDYARLTLDEMYDPPIAPSLRVLVAWSLTWIKAHIDSVASGPDAPLILGEQVWNIGTPLWSFLDPYVTNADFRLYCDETRHWYLIPAADMITGAITLGSLVALQDRIDREDWADSVVLVYDWTDITGTDFTKYVGAAVGSSYTRTMTLTKQSKATPTTAAAKAVANRMVTRGRLLAADAVSNYKVTPGQLITFNTVATQGPRALVSSVTWTFPGDRMRIITRDPPPAL